MDLASYVYFDQGQIFHEVSDAEAFRAPRLAVWMCRSVLLDAQQLAVCRESLVCIVRQFPWCKYLHHGQFQATDMASLKAELGRNTVSLAVIHPSYRPSSGPGT